MTTTPEQLEVVIIDLRQMQTGANVHTINKAVFYLRQWSTLSGEDDEDRARKFEAHVNNCRAAIEMGAEVGTLTLRYVMRRWI